MNLILRRFYQSVDLADPNQVKYFLVLETEAGKELLLPVQKETTEALVQAVYAEPKPTTFQEDVGHEHETEEDFAKFEKEADGEESDEEYQEQDEPQEDEDPEGNDLGEVDPSAGVLAASPRHLKKVGPKSEEEVPSL